MAATTPTGSFTTTELPSSSSQATAPTSSGIDEKVRAGSPAWIICESPIGIPSSVVMRAASSSPRSASFAPIWAQ